MLACCRLSRAVTTGTDKSVTICTAYLLVGLVVKAFAYRAADPGSIPAFAVDLLYWSSYTSDLKIYYSSGYPARHLAIWGSEVRLASPVSVY